MAKLVHASDLKSDEEILAGSSPVPPTMNPWLRSFSYSSLKQFETCPRQYGEITVHRNFKNVFTSPRGDYGDRLHKTAEAYIHYGGTIDADFEFLRPTLDVLKNSRGACFTEHKMAISHDGDALEWNSMGRWFQGIADIVIVSDSPIAKILDFKTGDVRYADTDQLELMSLLVFAHYPHVKYVKGRLLFVLSQQMRDRNVDIKERERLMQKYRERDARRLAAIEANNFPAKESGLCRKHCVVLTCPHNGRK